MTTIKKKIAYAALIIAGFFTFSGSAWYLTFAPTPYQVTQEQLDSYFTYSTQNTLNWQQSALDKTNYEFTYRSFDGEVVHGRIRYPQPLVDISAPIPVMIGAHGMGRSQIRWFQDSFKGRPTVESVDKIAEQALHHGYAVISIDARNHGQRKDPDYTIADVMGDLHYWGKREPYEAMIRDTVRDHRVLLDWVVKQPQFDSKQINIAGYSMGAQVSLLLASVDSRISDVAAVVPPHADDTTALVSPSNFLAGLSDNKVWLVTGDDDEYASLEENASFFNDIPSNDKKHLRFDSGHILPAHYVDQLASWF
ncbi:MAG: alpha/beta hydrolase family protein [Psychrobium sp.]